MVTDDRDFKESLTESWEIYLTTAFLFQNVTQFVRCLKSSSYPPNTVILLFNANHTFFVKTLPFKVDLTGGQSILSPDHFR